MNSQRCYLANSFCMLIVVGILCGAFWFQFVLHEAPCPLCLLQRMGMLGVILGLALNTQFGFDRRHFAAVILASLTGACFSIRQVLLHIAPAPDKPAGYGTPIFGMHLYTWGVLIFAASILGSACFLLLTRDESQEQPRTPSVLERTVLFLALIVCAVNGVSTFTMCGFGPCCENGPCP